MGVLVPREGATPSGSKFTCRTTVPICGFQLRVLYERWAPSTMVAMQVVGAWLDYHELESLGLPKVDIWEGYCSGVGCTGLGSPGPGRGQVSGEAGPQERTIACAWHLLNTKAEAPGRCLFLLMAGLKDSALLCQSESGWVSGGSH